MNYFRLLFLFNYVRMSHLSAQITPVCIIGAGPAGTTASLFLSKQGIQHILVDKESFPREKVCGEYFDGRVNAVLKRIDPRLIQEMLDKDVIQKNWRYALVSSSQKPFFIAFPHDRTPRLQTRRINFDACLLDKALSTGYAQFYGDSVVTKIEPQANGMLIHRRLPYPPIYAQMVIMACGSDSLLPARYLGDQRGESSDQFLFMRAHYHLREQLAENTTYAFIGKTPFDHCFYVCPNPGGFVNVEIAVDKAIWHKHGRPDLRKLLVQMVADNRLLRTQFEGAELSGPARGTSMHLYHPALCFSGERFLLAGEIAFSSNPVTGAGVGQAMTMGMHAATHAAAALQAGDCSAARLAAYDQNLRKIFKGDFRLGRFLTFLQRYPSVVDAALAVLNIHPRVARAAAFLATR